MFARFVKTRVFTQRRFPTNRVLRTPLKKFYSSGPIIGIDLGTTNSCVAVIQDDKPVVLENDGKRTTPSIISIDKQGNRLVGFPAQRQMVINPKNTFYAVKRLIGRRYNEKETQDLAKQVSYSVVAGPNGDAWVADDSGKKISPSEMGAIVLMKLKEVAEKHFGSPVTRAVITVPAYFDNHQRQATEDAGKIAGFKVERIINEPTAAALAYGISRDEDKTVAVYDLGGGTFDISILQMGSGVFEVKSTAGDTFLGGEDFNSVVINYIIDQFKKKENIDLSKDKIALQRVREGAENAKHELSSREVTRVSLPYITVHNGTPKNLDIEITRNKYEEMVKGLVDKTIGPCQKALKDAEMTTDDITDVILVGGMTRMPMVRDLVKKFFKKEPFIGVNPDEAVAVGAALQGEIIANSGLVTTGSSGEQKELVLLDVTPLNLGIELHDGTMAVIIQAQSPIPCTKVNTFTTVQPFQTELSTKVYQGNRPLAKDNRLLGEYVITGIPPAPAGVPKIDVTFTVSANGTITSISKDRASGVTKTLTITMSGGLSDAEIQRMKREAEQFKQQDEARQKLVQLQEEARKSISKFTEAIAGDTVSAEDKVKVKEQIDLVQSAIEKNAPVSELEKIVKQMETATGKIFADAYSARASKQK